MLLTHLIRKRKEWEIECDESLNAKAEGMTRLVYTMLGGELEYLKTKVRLKDEKFESVTGECEI